MSTCTCLKHSFGPGVSISIARDPKCPQHGQQDATPSIGERIAADFSANKRTLMPAEQRRLAGMIDAAIAEPVKALTDLLLVIEDDQLIPESVSYMKQARAVVAKAEGRASLASAK